MTHSAGGNSGPQLVRALGGVGATMVVIGSVIGSGIFFKANVIAQSVGRFDLVLLVWIVCGIMSLLGALASAELGAMMPQAGGQYVYLREAYGPLTGFLWGWGEFWMMRTGSTAALAVAFANAAYDLLGPAIQAWGWAKPVDVAGAAGLQLFGLMTVRAVWLPRVVAILAIVLLTWVNVLGTRWGGLTQNATTFLKMGTLAALIALPFCVGNYDFGNFASTHRPVSTANFAGLLAGFGLAMTSAFWAYDGWGNIGPVAEEVRDPQRNIPLSLSLGMSILIVLYVGSTATYHLVLNMGEIARTPETTSVAAQTCIRLFGQYGGAVAIAAIMCSTFGALNSNILVGPRVIFAMARDRLFLAPMARVHPEYRTPHVAIVAETAWAVLLILGADLMTLVRVPAWVASLPGWMAEPLTKSLSAMATKPLFDMLTEYVIFGQFVFYLLSVAAVFVLRVTRPDMPRPYKTPGYPVLPAIFVVGSAGFLFGMLLTSPVESLLGLIFIALGVVAYQFRAR